MTFGERKFRSGAEVLLRLLAIIALFALQFGCAHLLQGFGPQTGRDAARELFAAAKRNKDNPQLSIRLLEKAAAADPTFPDPLCLLSLTYSLKSNDDVALRKSVEYAEKLLLIPGNEAMAYWLLAESYHSLREPEKAIAYGLAALRYVDQKFFLPQLTSNVIASIYYGLAGDYVQLADYKNGLKYMKLFLKNSKALPASDVRLGVAKAALGKLEAYVALEQAQSRSRRAKSSVKPRPEQRKLESASSRQAGRRSAAIQADADAATTAKLDAMRKEIDTVLLGKLEKRIRVVSLKEALD